MWSTSAGCQCYGAVLRTNAPREAAARLVEHPGGQGRQVQPGPHQRSRINVQANSAVTEASAIQKSHVPNREVGRRRPW